MKPHLNTPKLIYFLFLLAYGFISLGIRAQSPSMTVTPSSQCYQVFSATTGTAGLSASVPGAISYSWSVASSASCVANVSLAVSNGSVVTIAFPCCGIYTLTCYALGSSSVLSTFLNTATISCPPTVSVSGNTSICAGSSTSLSAFGAQTYSWSSGATGSVIVVTPTANIIYTVIGSNFSGCTDTASAFVHVNYPPAPNFTYSQSPNGLITFYNTTTNTLSSTTYSWNFGNSAASYSTSPSTVYNSNGNYTVALTANNNTLGCGSSTYTHVILVSSVGSGTSCAASFTYTGSGGNYTFASTSSNVNSLTQYHWTFSNGASFSGTGTAGVLTSQTFTGNGTYTANLIIINAALGCTSTATQTILVTGIPSCSLNASFIYLAGPGDAMSFTSTSTGTATSTTYSWNYGDAITGTGVTSSHTYSNSGLFIVTLTANNNVTPICISTKTMAVLADTLCNLSANFTHTVGSNGQVHFTNNSTGVNASTIYYWNFGDGVYSTAGNPTHTYINAGTYYVTELIRDSLNVSCHDSLTQSINITGISCLANSNFVLAQAITPHYWIATPSYPWNITAATWSWGDGTISNSLYTSHLYSVSATYSICLSVTVSCGASSSYCYPYYVYKSTGDNNVADILSINVIAPGISTAVENIQVNNIIYTIYPNPNTGVFNIRFESAEEKNITINIYDLIGKIIYSAEEKNNGSFVKNIQLDEVSNGIYFIKISSGSKVLTQKIVINK
jgi:PKD repeat protein